MAKVNLITYLCIPLKCGLCEGVLIRLSDPTLLLVNDGQPIETWKSFIRGTVVSFQKVQAAQSNEIIYEYTIEYDDAVLLNPGAPLRDCDVRKLCCADCIIDYIDELLG